MLFNLLKGHVSAGNILYQHAELQPAVHFEAIVSLSKELSVWKGAIQFYTYYMKTYVLLHFEHKKDVTIIVKLLLYASSSVKFDFHRISVL